MARPIAEEFGRAFRSAYEGAGLTQTDLAVALQQRGWVKVDQSQISKWARGLFVPPLEVLPDVDAVCGQPIGHVLRLAGYVEDDGADVETAIRNDRRLTDERKLLLIDAYRGLAKLAPRAG